MFFALNQPAQQSTTISASETANTISTATGSRDNGTWVEWSGTPDGAANYWAEQGAYGNLENAHTQIETAQPDSTCVAGVVVKSNTIKTDGIVLAWVIKKKRTLELSGIYATSQNGIHVANTAIIQRGNFFVMARSKDDELETLMSQFEELTG
jgi:hypothetical protein